MVSSYSNNSKFDYDSANLVDITSKILLYNKRPFIGALELHTKYSNNLDFQLIACDFPIYGVEEGVITNYGIYHNGILNVDHHANIPEMRKNISSAVLAINYVKDHGPVDDGFKVIINHTDCDSMLSAMILTGYLPPDNVFAEAAVNADHINSPDNLVDLMQGIEYRRDRLFSATEVYKFLRGEKQTDDTISDILIRYAQREKIQNHISNGDFKKVGDIHYIEIEENIDAALVPQFLPEAVAVIIGHNTQNNKYNIKVRLGQSAPEGVYLNNLNLPDFGGRWNAGSTGRNGGTDLDPEGYAMYLNELLK